MRSSIDAYYDRLSTMIVRLREAADCVGAPNSSAVRAIADQLAVSCSTRTAAASHVRIS
jgi:hypothetical protein